MKKKQKWTVLFRPWLIDLAAFCSYLYCAFYLHDNHVVHPVYHTDVTLE